MTPGTEQRKLAAIIPQGGTDMVGYSALTTGDCDVNVTRQIRPAEILFGS